MDTDPNIVEYRTNIEGWVGKDGKFYGKDKDRAIRANSTHTKCEKGHVYGNTWVSCPECRKRDLSKRYLKMPERDWDGKAPLCLFDTDHYFWNLDEVLDYANEEGIEVSKLGLVICEPQYLNRIEEEYWEELIPDGFELSDIVTADFWNDLRNFNNKIDDLGPVSYIGGKYRTTIRLKK